ncbi:hypothetical protein PoB_005482600 [Plakobranchus ocellatus]|uniref:Uncharacterized protein n=1 Tax=Plakobranchus ocellatus TaxID=259542 RepID=A0AAV4CAF9_9GAST|nr:hypothetical protein PoB_005482600 [Plakobranchus ocellatus]
MKYKEKEEGEEDVEVEKQEGGGEGDEHHHHHHHHHQRQQQDRQVFHQATAPVTELEPAKEGTLQISKRVRYPLFTNARKVKIALEMEGLCS